MVLRTCTEYHPKQSGGSSITEYEQQFYQCPILASNGPPDLYGIPSETIRGLFYNRIWITILSMPNIGFKWSSRPLRNTIRNNPGVFYNRRWITILSMPNIGFKWSSRLLFNTIRNNLLKLFLGSKMHVDILTMNDKRRPVPCLRSLFKPRKSLDDPGRPMGYGVSPNPNPNPNPNLNH